MDKELAEKLKPLVYDLIKYYEYGMPEIDNNTSLHIALDDGNLSEGMIWSCQEFSIENKDTFGYFLATLLRYFTEEELEVMYDNDWEKR